MVRSQVFDPEALQLLCRRDLPAALRQLAGHLEQQEISGSLWSFQGNGMVQDWRREHFLMDPGPCSQNTGRKAVTRDLLS